LLHPSHILRYENVISESAGESSGCAIPATGLFDTQCHLILVELSLICHHPGRIAARRDLFGSCDSRAIAPKRSGTLRHPGAVTVSRSGTRENGLEEIIGICRRSGRARMTTRYRTDAFEHRDRPTGMGKQQHRP
jgi:hypothetical protein